MKIKKVFIKIILLFCFLFHVGCMSTILSSAKSGDMISVREQIEKGVDVNTTDSTGRSALLFASYKGHIDIVKYLVENGANVNILRGISEGIGTPLFTTLAGGHTDVAIFLIKNGADVNLASAQGGTPLMVAAETHSKDMVKTLIANGANVNASGISGNIGKTALTIAAFNGDLDIVKILVDDCAEVNQQTIDGATALLFATAGDNFDVAKYLLLQGADTSLGIDVNGRYYTPLVEAAATDSKDLVELLISYGALENKPQLIYARELAEKKGHSEMLKILS